MMVSYPRLLEVIIVLLALALVYAFRLRIKLVWLKLRLWELRQDVERLEAYRTEIQHRVDQARWRAKHKLPPAA